MLPVDIPVASFNRADILTDSTSLLDVLCLPRSYPRRNAFPLPPDGLDEKGRPKRVLEFPYLVVPSSDHLWLFSAATPKPFYHVTVRGIEYFENDNGSVRTRFHLTHTGT